MASLMEYIHQYEMLTNIIIMFCNENMFVLLCAFVLFAPANCEVVRKFSKSMLIFYLVSSSNPLESVS